MTNLAVRSQIEFNWQPTALARALLSRPARRVVKQWIHNERFLDSGGEPRLLRASGRAENGFDDLVHRADPLLSPTVVRNELLRKGVVELDEAGFILLRRSVYSCAEPAVIQGVFGDGFKQVQASPE